MTVRDCYNACLVELNKVQAPSLLLDDFVYLLNKNIQEYFNKKYNSFEKVQQNTDDLRHLINQITIEQQDKVLFPNSRLYVNTNVIYGKIYECLLPSDYVHILGCRAVFQSDTKKCPDSCRINIVGVNKLDTNKAPQIGTNWYMKPSHKRPYYQIVNIEQTNPIYIQNTPDSQKSGSTRYGNSTQPIMQIICGDNPHYALKALEIQYLQAPRRVTLSRTELDSVNDISEVLEFSDYVCNEIVKQLVVSILENQKDERLQSYIPVNTSIPQN